MRTFLFVSFFLISHVLLAQIKDLPRPARVVNDFGSFLTSREENYLEDELISYRKRTGNAIVIITLSTLPYSVEETALKYFNKWGIGDRVKNNGVLILVSRSPRRVNITTGIGIEDILTDSDCQRIIDETITPSFKAGDFYTGLKEGVNDIEATLGGGRRSAVNSGLHSEEQEDDQEAVAGEVPTQTQPQPQTQYAYNTYKREPMTVGKAIGGFLMLALIIWLRVRYVRSKRPATETYSAEGSSSTGNINTATQDYLNATGWVFLIMLRIIWWMFIFTFGILIFMFTLGRSRSFIRLPNKDAGGSFGGGRSNGGGASGSW